MTAVQIVIDIVQSGGSIYVQSGRGCSTSTILSARRQLSWPVDEGLDLSVTV